MRRLGLVLVLSAACGGRPSFDAKTIADAKLGADLPRDFLLGAASSAHQIEGGQNNDWTDWELGSYPDGRPHIKGGTPSGQAAGSWTRWPQDVAALRVLGANGYRLSIEWARLEPTPGAWDTAAADNYRAQLDALRAVGITPMVTLQHVTLPKWVAAEGGWEWAGFLDAFEAYSARAGREFGGRVDLWCTVNEPNVAAAEAYLMGNKPPGVKDIRRMARVYVNTMKAHARAAVALRREDTVDADGDGKATQVGIAHLVQWFEPGTWHTLDTMVAGLTDEFFNEAFPRAVRTGRVQLYVPGEVDLDERVPELVGTFDFLGLNYYRRDFLRFDIGSSSLATAYVPADLPRNGLGWEKYPEGLYRLLLRFSSYGWPIYITENGIADRTGEERPGYLRSHVYALSRAREAGANVRGYFHWSLMDNFEWTDGYVQESRFGLFSIDFADPQLTRTPTPAVETFRDIARNMGLSPQ